MKKLIRHILKEETEDIDKNVMNFLMRRYEVKKINVRDQKTYRIIKKNGTRKDGTSK